MSNFFGIVANSKLNDINLNSNIYDNQNKLSLYNYSFINDKDSIFYKYVSPYYPYIEYRGYNNKIITSPKIKIG